MKTKPDLEQLCALQKLGAGPPSLLQVSHKEKDTTIKHPKFGNRP
jgi:hypothetical protein